MISDLLHDCFALKDEKSKMDKIYVFGSIIPYNSLESNEFENILRIVEEESSR